MQFFKNIVLAAVALLPLTGVLAAPAAISKLKDGDVIQNNYIVVLKSDASSSDLQSHQAWAGRIHAESKSKRASTSAGFKHTYEFGKMKGYSGEFDEATIKEISSRPEVAFVEPDRVVQLAAQVTQASAPSWGLGRVSRRARGATSYVYDSSAGSGVTAYIIDTGIQITHNEFGGRARWGYNAIDTSDSDGNGHGTHVAGTVGGTNYGIAKLVSLVAVKVLDASGSGSYSAVIAGIQWATKDSAGKRAVANMSLGGTYSAAVNSAVTEAVNAGITFAVAAGNSNTDAGNTSPASTPSAITVGATDSTDSRASYSNYGSVLDVFAPGSSITSAWIGSNSATNTISGTSMASPHVCGMAAYLIAKEGLSSPSAVTNRIISLASSGYVANAGPGSPNRLLYNGSGL
ncbi:alkaline proteinase [Pyronema omphalodes]|nr:alkaline proteinase [Pyronema omphalodes]